jgi:ATP-dependent 26S proteasome regulatory subunit
MNNKLISKFADNILSRNIKTASANCPNGLSTVSREYAGMLIPMAQYILTKIVRNTKPIITSDIAFGKRMALTDIETDVDKTEAVVTGATLIYPEMIITAYKSYNTFNVNCFSKTRQSSLEWINNFEHMMKTQNHYRGKCLYVEGGMRFHDVPSVSWEDVVLSDKVKNDIHLNAVAFLGDAKLAKIGVTKRGIMLYGPPGTGKTSVVKAIFKELHGKKISRVYVTAESFQHGSVSDLFEILAYLGPTVLAFEDVDMIGVSRDRIASGSLLGDLLTNMDGMRNHKDPLVIIASTNKLSMLDEALANRPCRFDRKIEFGLPSPDHLRKIYHKLTGLNVNDDIIKTSKNFTGSHVVEAVNTARILAANEKKEIKDVLKDACVIIKENFFPGQSQLEIKTAARKVLKNI